MQRTSNYGLCQYEGSDKTSYLVNYNEDMLKIDTAIKNASDAASGAQSTADGAVLSAGTANEKADTLNTQINGVSGLATDVATLQGNVQTINSLIGNGEPTTTDKTLIGAINELDNDIQSLPTVNTGMILASIDTVQVSSDGVKNVSELFKDLADAIVAYAQALGTNEYGEVYALSLNTGYVHANSASPKITKDTESIGLVCSATQIIATSGTESGRIHELKVDSTAGNNYSRTIVANVAGTIVYADHSTDVPGSGANYIAYIEKWIPATH